MMIRLLHFKMLSDTWGHSQVEEQFFTLTNLLSHLHDALPSAHCRRITTAAICCVSPHRTLKEAESIAGQLIKAVDTLPNKKMLDCDDIPHWYLRLA
ncbi:diguanylate cyclase domain-containing protein [Shigella flexneri]